MQKFRLSKTAPTDTAATDPGLDDAPRIGRTMIGAGVVIVSFVVGFIAWASLAPLDSATIANGVVSVEGKSKTIQHLEGGIVRAIRVVEGEQVRAGQVLVELDPTKALAGLELLQGRYLTSLALESRLRAERDGAREIQFPAALIKHRRPQRIREIVQSQRNIFKIRRAVLAEQLGIMNQRTLQSAQEIVGLKGRLASEKKQLDAINSEIEGVAKLLKKGLVRKPRYLALTRRAAEIEGRRYMIQAQIARAGQVTTETRLRVNAAKTARLNEVVERLRAAQAGRYDLEERLLAGRDVMKRTKIRAPISGAVVGLDIHTEGGVIGPGDRLMDIVPSKKRLIVEARISPKDIDMVHRGLATRIRFTAFNQRSTPPVEGVINSVSADRMTDEATGELYYLAQVGISEQAIKIPLQPGMPAEVMIITDRRTLMGYMLAPITKSLNRAFRES